MGITFFLNEPSIVREYSLVKLQNVIFSNFLLTNPDLPKDIWSSQHLIENKNIGIIGNCSSWMNDRFFLLVFESKFIFTKIRKTANSLYGPFHQSFVYFGNFWNHKLNLESKRQLSKQRDSNLARTFKFLLSRGIILDFKTCRWHHSIG